MRRGHVHPAWFIFVAGFSISELALDAPTDSLDRLQKHYERNGYDVKLKDCLVTEIKPFVE